VSLRSIQDVERYREVFDRRLMLDSIAELTDKVARKLEEFWNKFAIPLGRLEGAIKSYMRSKEFGVIAKHVPDAEDLFRRIIELREEFSKLSHEFLREVVYDQGYGLNFLAMVTGARLGKLQDIARKTKSAPYTLELFKEMLRIHDLLSDHLLDYTAGTVGTMMAIDKFIREAGLKPVWDINRVQAIEEQLSRVGFELSLRLVDAIIMVPNGLRHAIERGDIAPGDEYYDEFVELVEWYKRIF
jgi:hypothetical protein